MKTYHAIFECNPVCPYWGKTPYFETEKEVHDWIEEGKRPPDEIVAYEVYCRDEGEILISKHVLDREQVHKWKPIDEHPKDNRQCWFLEKTIDFYKYPEARAFRGQFTTAMKFAQQNRNGVTHWCEIGEESDIKPDGYEGFLCPIRFDGPLRR